MNGRPRKVVRLKATLAKIEEEELKISSEFIKLDSALKLADLAQTGGHAKILVSEGNIRVNGEPCTQRGKKLRPGDNFQLGRQLFKIISEE